LKPYSEVAINIKSEITIIKIKIKIILKTLKIKGIDLE